jgi:hypothetical protein
MRSASVGQRHPQSQRLWKRRELERRPVEHGGRAFKGNLNERGAFDRERWLAVREAGGELACRASTGRHRRTQDAPPPAPHPFNWVVASPRTFETSELRPGVHPQLSIHLAQVVLDGAQADEELRRDLAVCAAVRDQSRDLRLLPREQTARSVGSRPAALTGRRELTAGALGERPGSDAVEALERSS